MQHIFPIFITIIYISLEKEGFIKKYLIGFGIEILTTSKICRTYYNFIESYVHSKNMIYETMYYITN